MSDMLNPECVDFSISENEIQPDNELVVQVRNQVMDGDIVVLKNVFGINEMLEFRKKIITWGKENEIFPHGESPSKYPELNYHRIDDGSVPSVCPHIFHQYAFNSIDKLKKEDADFFNGIVRKLVRIQNSIAETNFVISLDGLRLKILQYPEGGGFLAEHTHPKEPQQIGIILSLSAKGKDFEEGAAAFTTKKGFISTVETHNIGDVVIFRYDLPHSVTPVNSNKESIDWTLETGKWSVVLELRDTHNLSHKK